MIPQKRGADRDFRIFLWAVIVVLAAATLLASTAQAVPAYTGDARLDAFASKIAMRPVSVRCYHAKDVGSPYGYGAWGYVIKPTGKARFTAIDADLCEGALAVNDRSLPVWKRALGVEVITHESYHLRRWGANQNEAKTQCKAVRHWKTAARLLGATEATVAELWPFALASHYKLAEYENWLDGGRPYYDPSCQVPPLFEPPVYP